MERPWDEPHRGPVGRALSHLAGSLGPEDRATRIALRRGGLVLGTLFLLALATYLIPEGTQVDVGGWVVEFDRLKPWAPGDPVPLARWTGEDADRDLPAFAGAGGAYRAPGQAAAEARLGRAVAQNLGPKSRGPGRSASGRRGPASNPGVVVDPSEYEGIEVELERPEALRSFHEALQRTARREFRALTRIGHYGDSSIATDLITHTVRRHLQRRFGDGGHGFHLIARGTMPYGHRDVRHRAGGRWILRQLVNQEDRQGFYGYGGVAYRAGAGARAMFGTDARGPVGRRVSRFALWFRQTPDGGRVDLRIDNGEPELIDTRGAPQDVVEVRRVRDGAHKFELRARGGGQVHLYGVVLEREGPGVVYDSMGLVGARARRLLYYDAAHIQRQMELRDLDLLVLAFGGNEADDPVRRMPAYAPEYRKVIQRMRGGRRTACLVVAPLDQAGRDRYGRIATMPTVPLIVQAQREAARAEGCAFFDTFRAMGGEGAMRNWVRARPRLALTDYRHATPAGYEVIGNLFYKALLKSFADYLAR